MKCKNNFKINQLSLFSKKHQNLLLISINLYIINKTVRYIHFQIKYFLLLIYSVPMCSKGHTLFFLFLLNLFHSLSFKKFLFLLMIVF